MPASLQTPLIGLAIGLGLVAATFALERVSRKPRFVIALSLVAATMAVVGFVEIVGQTEDYRHVWLGMNLSGRFAVAAGLVDIAIYMVGAVGLWLLKRWARTGAMIYLLYLLVSFVIWGVRGGSGEGVVVIMAWQMFVLPFITFSLMYLQGGAAYFGVDPNETERKTGWLY